MNLKKLISSKILKNSFIYLISDIFSKAIPFFLIPIIIKVLTPEEYGLYGLYQVIITFLSSFINMNLQSNITRNFFKSNIYELRKIILTVFIILFFNTFVVNVIIFMFLINNINIFGLDKNILGLIPYIVFFQSVNVYYFTILKNKEYAKEYGIYKFLITVINYILLLLLLFEIDKTWKSLVYSTLFTYSFFALYSFFKIQKEYKLFRTIKILKFEYIKNIYIYSFPLIFSSLGGVIIFLFDRIFIKIYLGLNAVGVYTLANQISSMFFIVVNSLMLAITPNIQKKLSNGINVDMKLRMIMFFFFVFLFALSLIVEKGFDYVIDNKNYFAAKELIILFALAAIFRSWYQILFAKLLYYSNSKIFMWSNLIAAAFNVILNSFFIPVYGIKGAVYSTIISFFIMYLILEIYNLKFLNSNSKIRKEEM